MHSTRRAAWPLFVALTMLLAFALIACSGDDDDDEPESTPPADAASETATAPPATASPAASPNNAASGAFPVTVTHKYGEADIPARPERIITIGFSEQDPVLALGVQPIAVREWFGGKPYAIWPWAEDALGDATPDVLNMPFGELDYETLATLDPDLFIATHSGITADEYDTLSAIAPTIAQPDGYPDFGAPWQEQTRIIGQALGLEEQANALVTTVESQIAAAGEQYPQFAGATVAWVTPAGAGQFNATGPTTPPMRFLEALGLQMPEELASAIGDLDSLLVSGEQLHLLDADVLILAVSTPEERAAVEADPLFQQLSAVREGRLFFFESIEDPAYGSLSFSTVLSLPYAVEELVPQLAATLGNE